MQIRSLVEVEPPSPLRYLIGAAVMMIGVVLPVGYMMFRNKRVPSSSSYSKQTETTAAHAGPLRHDPSSPPTKYIAVSTGTCPDLFVTLLALHH
ncbi:hypothetical protein JHK82_011947 [Glycine max]|nr:hypothetical protein JHK82_011947 [Glycine max]